jgi:hypothetical protein
MARASKFTATFNTNFDIAQLEGKELSQRMNNAIRQIGQNAESFWRGVAGQYLHSTYDTYVSGIRTEFHVGANNIEYFTLFLKGNLACALEFGKPGWNMVDTHLKGASHRIIPIRERLKSQHQKMFSWTDGDSNYARKQAGNTATLLHTRFAKQLGLRSLNRSARAMGGTGRVFAPAKEGRGLSDIQFRTMSRNSATKWYHPAFIGYNIRERVRDYINDTLIPRYMGDVFGNVFSNMKSRRGSAK